MTFDEIKFFLHNRNLSRYENIHFTNFLAAVEFQYHLPTIHITGTNGKSSVANFISNIYRKEYQVGVFVSPFVSSYLDMIMVNGVCIKEAEFAEIFNKYAEKFVSYDLSEFEIVTFIALQYFLSKKIQLAIVEAGMGGKIDATNIFANVLTIITTISLEHTEYLGRTPGEIAVNKGGLISQYSEVLVGSIDDDSKDILYQMTKKLKSNFHQINDYVLHSSLDGVLLFDYLPFKNLRLAAPKYQLINASLAIEAIKILMNSFPVSLVSIQAAFNEALLPLRFERIDNIILDGAHNPEAIDSLVDSLDKSKHYVVLFAAFKDKNVEKMLSILSREVDKIYLTTFDHVRARDEESYFLFLNDYEFVTDYQAIIKQYHNDPDIILLVTGSLAFTSLIRGILSEKNNH